MGYTAGRKETLSPNAVVRQGPLPRHDWTQHTLGDAEHWGEEAPEPDVDDDEIRESPNFVSLPMQRELSAFALIGELTRMRTCRGLRSALR